MTTDYTIMDPVVDKICESLRTEPEKWKLDQLLITAPKSLGSIQIEKGLHSTFTEVRLNSHTSRSEAVFSLEQGRKIAKAYYYAKSKIGSQLQQDILSRVTTPKEEPVKVFKPELKSKDNEPDTTYYTLYIIIIGLLIYILTSGN